MANAAKASEGRSKGGQNSGGNFRIDPKRASVAGKKVAKARTADGADPSGPDMGQAHTA
jgi:general stress protein YciG